MPRVPKQKGSMNMKTKTKKTKPETKAEAKPVTTLRITGATPREVVGKIAHAAGVAVDCDGKPFKVGQLVECLANHDDWGRVEQVAEGIVLYRQMGDADCHKLCTWQNDELRVVEEPQRAAPVAMARRDLTTHAGRKAEALRLAQTFEDLISRCEFLDDATPEDDSPDDVLRRQIYKASRPLNKLLWAQVSSYCCRENVSGNGEALAAAAAAAAPADRDDRPIDNLEPLTLATLNIASRLAQIVSELESGTTVTTGGIQDDIEGAVDKVREALNEVLRLASDRFDVRVVDTEFVSALEQL